MTSRILFSIALILAACSSAFAQPANNNSANATTIPHQAVWCSANGAYTTMNATADGAKPSTWPNGPNNNVWFKFQATTTAVAIDVKTGSTEGTMQFPNLALHNSSLTELASAAQNGQFVDVGLSYEGLTIGNWYYINVDNGGSLTNRGTFKVCINTSPFSDYPNGAVYLTHTNWCSANESFTTMIGTPNGAKPSNVPFGPIANVWFRFQATATTVSIDVKTGGSEGTLDRPSLALYTNSLTELRSVADAGSTDDIGLSYDGLTVGSWYYFSVDNGAVYNERGTFKVCISTSTSSDYPANAVVVPHSAGWCSSLAGYTTAIGTPNGTRPSNWFQGPNNNVWFKFQATAATVSVGVKTNGTEGTMDRAMVALYNNSFTELRSIPDAGSTTDVGLSYDALTIGDWYYIAVDNGNQYYERGTFTLCVDTSTSYDYPSGAVVLTDLNNWCSGQAAYSTAIGTPNGTKPTNWQYGPSNNVWFKFQATTTAVTVDVKVGGSEGTLQKPKVALHNNSLSELTSVNEGGVATDLSLSYGGLTVGDWYYINVDNGTQYYERGTFTLCVNSAVSFDYSAGAIELSHSAGCSSLGAYTTTSASSDGTKPGYWLNGPNNNVWFKFQATTTAVSVDVKTGDSEGTLRKPSVALHNSSLTEIRSTTQNQQYEDVGLSYDALTIGNWYYINVDNGNQTFERGTFTICLNNTVSSDYPAGAITLTHQASWCSGDAAYTNMIGFADGSRPSGWNAGPNYNVWFKFQATTPDVSVLLKTGDNEGWLRKPMLALHASNMSVLRSVNENGQYEDIGVSYEGLTIGNWYYINVDGGNLYYERGAFSLCVSNQSSYDYPSQAVELTNLNNWCSPNAAYTTMIGTPNGSKPGPWSNGPNANVWFKFTANRTTATINVKVAGAEGTMARARVALHNSSLGVVQAVNEAGNTNDITLNATGLTVGNLYYINVDNGNQYYYRGTFTLCVDNALPAPTALTATPQTGGAIKLDWAHASDSETGFQIERSTTSGSGYTLIHTAAANAITYTDATTLGNSLYYYRVRAVNSAGNSTYTSEVSATTLPQVYAAPELYEIFPVNYDWVQLSWSDNSTAETSFEVHRSLTSGSGFSLAQSVGTDIIQADETGLAQTTTYYYKVRAVSPYGASPFSNEVSVTTAAQLTIIPEVSAFRLPDHIGLTMDPYVDALYYEIERSTTSGSGYTYLDFIEIANIDPFDISFTDQTVAPGTTYYYRVRAWSDVASSVWSSEVSVKSNRAPSFVTNFGTLTFTQVIDDNEPLVIEVTDPDPEDDTFNFTVDNFQPGLGTYEVLSPNTFRFNFSISAGLFPGNKQFYLHCDDEAGKRITKTINVLILLGPPAQQTNVAAEAYSTGGAMVTWSNPALNESGIQVERSTSPTEGFSLINTTFLNDVHYFDPTPVELVTNYYRVRAINAYGPSAYSNVASVSVPIRQPSSLYATTAATSISLAWTDNSGVETGYQVERSTNPNNGFALVGTTQPNVASFSDDIVTPGTQYYYRVRAVTATVNSGYSNLSGARANRPPSFITAPYSVYIAKNDMRYYEFSFTDPDGDDLTWSLEDNESFWWLEYASENSLLVTVTPFTETVAGPHPVVVYLDDEHGSRATVTLTVNVVDAAPLVATYPEFSNVAPTSVTLTWADNSSSESGYRIERSENATTGFSVVTTTAANVTTFTDTNLVEATKYFYRVLPIHPTLTLVYAPFVDNPSFPVTTTLKAPTNFSGFSGSGVKPVLSWNPVSERNTAYEIEMLVGSTWTLIHTSEYHDENRYVHTALTAHQTYSFRMRAVRDGEIFSTDDVYSTYTDVLSILMHEPVPHPSNFNLELVGTGVRASWRIDSPGADGFVVERSTTLGSGYTTVGTVGATATSYTDNTAVTGVTYYYRVAGFKLPYYSYYLSPQSFTVLEPTPGLMARAGSSTSAYLAWTNNTSTYVQYKIERSLTAVGGYSLVGTVNSSTSSPVTYFADHSLQPNTPYYYRVQTLGPNEGAAVSSPVSLTTMTSEMVEVMWTSLSGVSTGTNSLTKTAASGWGNNAGALSENVLRENANGKLVYTVYSLTQGDFSFGFDDYPNGYEPQNIRSAFHRTNGPETHVQIGGQTLHTFNVSPLDQLVIERAGYYYRFWVNDEVVYTLIDPPHAVTAIVGLNTQGSRMEGLAVNFSQNLKWGELVGVSEPSTIELVKTAASGYGNAGAASLNVLGEGNSGWAEFTLDALNKDRTFGLTDANLDNNSLSIDFGFITTGTIAQILENGLIVQTINNVGVNDVFRIGRTTDNINSTMTWYRNGTSVYSNTSWYRGGLRVDAAISTNGAKIYKGKASFDLPEMPGYIPPTAEFTALNDMYQEMDGQNWIHRDKWPPVSNWPLDLYGTDPVSSPRNNVTLNNNNLSGFIPSTIWGLTNLWILALNDNHIKGFEPFETDASALHSLWEINLSHNEITSLPDELFLLPALSILDVSHNLLTSVPATYGYLERATSLNFSNNQITEIPSTFGTDPLEFPVGLIFDNNLISTIPEALGGYGSFSLSLANNRISVVPTYVAGFSGLTGLNLEGNQLTRLPSNLIGSQLHMNVANNFLDFADLEPFVQGGTTFSSYAPQRIAQQSTDMSIVIGAPWSINPSVNAGEHSTIVWEKLVGGVWQNITATSQVAGIPFKRNEAVESDAGMYRWTMTNSVVTGLTLQSNEIEVGVIDAMEAAINNFGFQYKYDDRGRMTGKKVPGADWSYMVYDERDRLVMTQDGNQRLSHQWMYTRYDALNRPVISGVYTHTATVDQAGMQALIGTTVQNEVFNKDWSSNFGYSANAFFALNQNNFTVLSVTYYDDYNFLERFDEVAMMYRKDELDNQYVDADNDDGHFLRVRGLVTGTVTAVLSKGEDELPDNNRFLQRVNYYDNKSNLVQSISLNLYSGYDIITHGYDFVGQETGTRTRQGGTLGETVVTRTFDYDHTGRLQKTWHQLGDGPEGPKILLLMNSYNPIGQVVDKGLHNMDSPEANDATRQFRQSVDYAYNIRGWITSINNSALSVADPNSRADLFGMDLLYNTVDSNVGNDELFNGNVSAIKWSTWGSTRQRAYKFEYNSINWLTSANQKALTDQWADTPDFAEKDLEYDLNGNIKKLTRTGKNNEQIDLLDYNYGEGGYATNQLLSITDNYYSPSGFKDGNEEGNDYEYDRNGNMVVDRNKNITSISYNHLNRPEKVSSKRGTYVRYVYDASGNKLQQLVMQPAGDEGSDDDDLALKVTDYVGEFVYENHQPRFASHEEGRVVFAGSEELYNNAGDDPGSVEEMNATVVAAGNDENHWLTITPTSAATGLEAGLESLGGMFNAYQGESYTVKLKGFNIGSPVSMRVTVGSATWYVPVELAADESGMSWSEYPLDIEYEGVMEVGLVWENTHSGDVIHLSGFLLQRNIILAEPEYQYNLKDHLGNVRLTFSAKDEVDAPHASLENADETSDKSKFHNYDNARRINSELLDKTFDASIPTDGAHAQRLSGVEGERMGLARSIAVMPGDRILPEVYAKYLDPSGTNFEAVSNVVNAILAAQNGGSPDVVDGGGYVTGDNVTIPHSADLVKTDGEDGLPRAYLNWMVFDTDFNVIPSKMGYKRVTIDAMDNGNVLATLPGGETVYKEHERVAPDDPIEIDQAGYVYVWISNEMAEGDHFYEVFFDEFKVEHVKSEIVQSDDYYPFGLTFGSYSRESSLINQHKFGGKEIQDELAINWADFGNRMYSPEIGRWNRVDDFSDKYHPLSPYNYALNNPLRYMDPLGDSIIKVNIIDRTGYIHGKTTVYIDHTIYADLMAILNVAAKTKTHIYLESSFRTNKRQQEVIDGKGTYTPAKPGTSTHNAGLGFDFKVYTNNDFAQGPIKDNKGVTKDNPFIAGVLRLPGWQWGGDWSSPDPIHIDKRLGITPAEFTAMRDASQEQTDGDNNSTDMDKYVTREENMAVGLTKFQRLLQDRGNKSLAQEVLEEARQGCSATKNKLEALKKELKALETKINSLPTNR